MAGATIQMKAVKQNSLQEIRQHLLQIQCIEEVSATKQTIKDVDSRFCKMLCAKVRRMRICYNRIGYQSKSKSITKDIKIIKDQQNAGLS